MYSHVEIKQWVMATQPSVSINSLSIAQNRDLDDWEDIKTLNQLLHTDMALCIVYMGWVMGVWLSCYLVLLSTDNRTT